MTEHKMDLTLCQGLAVRGAEGDPEASRQLTEHLWPVWRDMVSSSRRMRSLGKSEDHVHNVVAQLVPKVDEHSLGLYLQWAATHPEQDFGDWMRIVVANVERGYVETQLALRSSSPEGPSKKRLLNEATTSPLLEELGIRPPFTAQATAMALLEFARSRLPSGQLRALELWLQDRAFDEIGRELGVPGEEARKLLRAAVAVLRRHFGTDGEGGEAPA